MSVILEFFSDKYRRLALTIGAIASWLGVAIIAYSQPVIHGLIKLNDVIPHATDLDKASPEQLASLTLENPALHGIVFNYSNGIGMGLAVAILSVMFCAASFIGRPYQTGSAIYDHIAIPVKIHRWVKRTSAVVLCSMLYLAAVILISLPIYLSGVAVSDTWKLVPLGEILINVVLSVLVSAITSAISASFAWLARSATRPLIFLATLLIIDQVVDVAFRFFHIQYLSAVLPFSAIKSVIPLDLGTLAPNLQPQSSHILAIFSSLTWAVVLLAISAWSENRREIPIIS